MGKKIVIVFLLLSLVGLGLFFLSFRSSKNWNNPDFKNIPVKINNWEGKDESFSEEIYQRLAASETLLRKYTKEGTGEVIYLWAAYYRDQMKSTAHIPRICFIGQGWNTQFDGKEDIEINESPKNILNMKKLVMKRENSNQVIYYWFQSQDKIFNDELYKNIYRFTGAVFNNRTDLTFIRISMITANDKDAEQLKQFIRDIYPSIQKEIPR
ncbi:EpsI family protein [Candidatus Desantisbacteria bacterium]|nr:EpsI family protein [Candidatus Desantisbacteria bacterium]